MNGKGIAPTSSADLDKALQTLRANSERYLKLSIRERLQLLQGMLDGFQRVAERWVRAGCEAKGLDFDSAVGGEEWLAGPMLVIRNVRLLMGTLGHLEANGKPLVPPTRTLPNGQVAVSVFPTGLYDKLLYTGFSGTVWLEPGIKEADVARHVAVPYQNPPSKPGVSLVLGAGNVASIAPMDALHKLFHELKTVIIKMNPVNEYLGPIIEDAFSEAIKEGYLRVVYGAGDVGAYLCNHELVDDIHITGSDETHDLIVWGPPGPDRERRRAMKDPKLKKPITSELGNVSPVVVAPARFSERELTFQAENVASMLTNNGGFNCNAAKVLVLAEGWEQREAFIDRLSQTLDGIPQRRAYYPGARDRHAAFVQGRQNVRLLGTASPDSLPWAIIRGLDSSNKNELCFTKEAFCSILGETTLPAKDPVDFIRQATAFCNDVTWGTLNVSLIVHPSIEATSEGKAAVEAAIQSLRYGTIAINHWGALGYGFVSTPWGGHSGATVDNVQSGIGWVHNSYMIEDIQKSVVRGPFVVNPRPAWFRTNRRTNLIGRKMVGFESRPSVWKLPGVVLEALRG